MFAPLQSQSITDPFGNTRRHSFENSPSGPLYENSVDDGVLQNNLASMVGSDFVGTPHFERTRTCEEPTSRSLDSSLSSRGNDRKRRNRESAERSRRRRFQRTRELEQRLENLESRNSVLRRQNQNIEENIAMLMNAMINSGQEQAIIRANRDVQRQLEASKNYD